MGFIKAFDQISMNGCVVTMEKNSTIRICCSLNCSTQGVLVNRYWLEGGLNLLSWNAYLQPSFIWNHTSHRYIQKTCECYTIYWTWCQIYIRNKTVEQRGWREGVQSLSLEHLQPYRSNREIHLNKLEEMSVEASKFPLRMNSVFAVWLRVCLWGLSWSCIAQQRLILLSSIFEEVGVRDTLEDYGNADWYWSF